MTALLDYFVYMLDIFHNKDENRNKKLTMPAFFQDASEYHQATDECFQNGQQKKSKESNFRKMIAFSMDHNAKTLQDE